MKNLLTFAFVLVSSITFAQTEKVNFSIEGSFAASDVIFFNKGFTSSIVEDYPSNLKLGGPTFDLGGMVSIQMNEKLELQTGVKILTQTSLFRLKNLNWGSDFMGFDDNGEPIISPATRTPQRVSFSDRSYFAEIPLRLNFRMKGKLDAFKISVGQSLTINFLNTRAITKVYDVNSESNKTSTEVNNSTNLRKLNSHTQVGFIWETMIKNGNYLSIFPNVRFQTLGRAIGTSSNRRYLIYGITAGISI